MKAQEALTKIRVMLGMEAEAETNSVELAEATLIDGTVVKVEGDLAEGKALVVVTDEGEIPAPQGVHETTDGLLVSVNAEGVITAVEEKPVEAEVEQEMADEAIEAPVAEAKSYDEDFLAQIAGLISPLQEKLDAMEAKYQTLSGEFSAFKDEPAAERITNNLHVGTEDIKSHGARQEQRMKTLLELRKQK